MPHQKIHFAEAQAIGTFEPPIGPAATAGLPEDEHLKEAELGLPNSGKPEGGLWRERLLKEREAASALNLSIRTLRNWRVLGRGPPFLKLGRAVRYRRSDIEVWQNEAVRTSTSG
jgi:predicted DNA-binding transcriptional regulator AlpA